MDGLTSIAGAWSFFSDSARDAFKYGAIGLGGAIVVGAGICFSIPSCRSEHFRPTTTPVTTSANVSTNPVNASGNTSPKPAITSSTPVNSTLNQKSNTSATQGGRRTHSRHTKRARQNSKKTRRSRK